MTSGYIELGDRTIGSDVETPPRIFREAWAVEGGVSTPSVVLDLALTKKVAHNLVNSWRNYLDETPIQFQGDWFDTDTNSRSTRNVMGAAQVSTLDIISGRAAFLVPWTTHFGDTVLFSSEMMTQLGVTMAMRTSEIYVLARVIKDAIAQADTPEKVVAIVQSMDDQWTAPTVPLSL